MFLIGCKFAFSQDKNQQKPEVLELHSTFTYGEESSPEFKKIFNKILKEVINAKKKGVLIDDVILKSDDDQNFFRMFREDFIKAQKNHEFKEGIKTGLISAYDTTQSFLTDSAVTGVLTLYTSIVNTYAAREGLNSYADRVLYGYKLSGFRNEPECIRGARIAMYISALAFQASPMISKAVDLGIFNGNILETLHKMAHPSELLPDMIVPAGNLMMLGWSTLKIARFLESAYNYSKRRIEKTDELDIENLPI